MIRFCPEAATEIEEALDWYLARSLAVAERFYRTLSSLLKDIESDPARFAKFHLDFQYGRVAGFPYICVFRVKQGYTQILAIAHTSRKDRYWLDRDQRNR
jgi:plasmid stabilization system protein ParE